MLAKFVLSLNSKNEIVVHVDITVLHLFIAFLPRYVETKDPAYDMRKDTYIYLLHFILNNRDILLNEKNISSFHYSLNT